MIIITGWEHRSRNSWGGESGKKRKERVLWGE
jgi:hypothetical protein